MWRSDLETETGDMKRTSKKLQGVTKGRLGVSCSCAYVTMQDAEMKEDKEEKEGR